MSRKIVSTSLLTMMLLQTTAHGEFTDTIENLNNKIIGEKKWLEGNLFSEASKNNPLKDKDLITTYWKGSKTKRPTDNEILDDIIAHEDELDQHPLFRSAVADFIVHLYAGKIDGYKLGGANGDERASSTPEKLGKMATAFSLVKTVFEDIKGPTSQINAKKTYILDLYPAQADENLDAKGRHFKNCRNLLDALTESPFKHEDAQEILDKNPFFKDHKKFNFNDKDGKNRNVIIDLTTNPQLKAFEGFYKDELLGQLIKFKKEYSTQDQIEFLKAFKDVHANNANKEAYRRFAYFFEKEDKPTLEQYKDIISVLSKDTFNDFNFLDVTQSLVNKDAFKDIDNRLNLLKSLGELSKLHPNLWNDIKDKKYTLPEDIKNNSDPVVVVNFIKKQIEKPTEKKKIIDEVKSKIASGQIPDFDNRLRQYLEEIFSRNVYYKISSDEKIFLLHITRDYLTTHKVQPQQYKDSVIKYFGPKITLEEYPEIIKGLSEVGYAFPTLVSMIVDFNPSIVPEYKTFSVLEKLNVLKAVSKAYTNTNDKDDNDYKIINPPLKEFFKEGSSPTAEDYVVLYSGIAEVGPQYKEALAEGKKLVMQFADLSIADKMELLKAVGDFYKQLQPKNSHEKDIFKTSRMDNVNKVVQKIVKPSEFSLEDLKKILTSLAKIGDEFLSQFEMLHIPVGTDAADKLNLLEAYGTCIVENKNFDPVYINKFLGTKTPSVTDQIKLLNLLSKTNKDPMELFMILNRNHELDDKSPKERLEALSDMIDKLNKAKD